MFWFLLRNWQAISIGVILIAMLGGGAYVGVHYKGLLDDKKVSEQKIAQLERDINDFDAAIVRLNKTMKENSADLDRYINTIKRLQNITNDIQERYNSLLEKMNNAKLPLNDNGTLSEPVILIHPGLPQEYRDLKASKRNSN
jgi:hypothetical protein